MFYIATAVFNLALAVTTISDVVGEGFRHAARRRRIIARKRKQRRQQRKELEATRRANEFVYHGGGKKTHDPMKHTEFLHMTTDKGFKDGLLDILMFWKTTKHHQEGDEEEEEEEDSDDIWRDILASADAGGEGTPVLEEDKHLFLPRTINGQQDDPDVQKEVDSESRSDNLQRVRFPSLRSFVGFAPPYS